MKPREYIDFKLYLAPAPNGQGGCQVALLPTPEVGESMMPVTVPAGDGPPADLLPFLAAKSVTWRQLVALGQGLANWLLPEGEVRKLFEEALKRAGNEGGVRLRLIIAGHELKRWPWEYAYFDPLGGPPSLRGFLALEPRVSIVRHEPLPFAHPVLPGSAPGAVPARLPMVVAAASPREQLPLQLEREVQIIRDALEGLNVEGVRVSPEPVLMGATPLEVADVLRGVGSATIFHFIGHGTARATADPFSRDAMREEGVLFFVGDKAANSQAEVRADDLARLLQQAAVRLAVLGACYSGLRSERYPWDSVAGALAARGIPAAVTMQYEVIDTMAVRFSQSFYGALAAGLSLDEAMTLGRLAMLRETGAGPDEAVNLEWGVPVLYSRLPGGTILPELAARDTETARQMRTTIQQTIDTIAETGEVVGIDAEVLDGALSFHVKQKVGTVAGHLVGIRIGRVP